MIDQLNVENGEGSASYACGFGDGLTMPEDFLPQRLLLGQIPPNDDSTLLKTVRAGGQPAWVIFFASWCPDCERQFTQIEQMAALADKYGVRLILIDRLNPERETKEAALAVVEELRERISAGQPGGAGFRIIEDAGEDRKRDETKDGSSGIELYFDENEALYQSWGIREIPTSVVLDSDGRTLAYDNGVLTTGECEGLLQSALQGPDKATIQFLLARMVTDDGGVLSVLPGAVVLSESQGLLMEYAALTGDAGLFETAWNYVRRKLLTESGQISWRSVDGERADTDALLDDLRILKALVAAGRTEEAEALREAILAYDLRPDGKPVDFATKYGGQAGQISLCYLDLDALWLLDESDVDAAEVQSGNGDRFADGVKHQGSGSAYSTVKAAQDLLTGGYISDSFPLYYSAFDYESGEYSREELHTAEALITLLHLSESGLLKSESYEWLRRHVEMGDLAARYDVNGNPVRGYDYYSTAVYGIAAMIAASEQDAALYTQAVNRMERLRVTDADSEWYGSYGIPGEEHNAFDQCIPMLVHAINHIDVDSGNK